MGDIGEPYIIDSRTISRLQSRFARVPPCVLPVSYTHLDVYKRQHLDHPITERGQDVVSYHGMVGVDGIASPGIVFVVAFVARQHVEDRVIHPTETERRSQFVSLCRICLLYTSSLKDPSISRHV